MGRRVSPAELRRASDEFRRMRGLFQPEMFRAWMDENELDVSGLEQFLRDEASIAWLDQGLALASEQMMLDHLRFSGDYGALREQAVLLGESVVAAGADDDDPQWWPSGITKLELWTWYFTQLGRPVPDNLAAYAASLGFADTVALQAAVLKRFLASVKKGSHGPT